MSGDRLVALELALTAVVQTAREAGMDVNELCEYAAEILKANQFEAEWHLTLAIMEVEKATAFVTSDHHLTG